MSKSSRGTPTNIIHGTNEIVRMNVLRYNGRDDNCCPKKNKNSVIEG
jgi:hypothetical protein